MAYRFYRKEADLFDKYQHIHIPDEHVQTVVNKLVRHFKIRCKIHTRLFGYRGGRAYKGWKDEIRVPHNPSIHMLAHEVGHFKVWKHTKQLITFVKRILQYAEKMNYWNLSISKEVYDIMKFQEKQKRLDARGLTVFYKCLQCGFIESLNLSSAYRGNLTWAKQYYAVGSIKQKWHCNGCHKTVDKQMLHMKMLNVAERHAEEKLLNAHYMYPLMIRQTGEA